MNTEILTSILSQLENNTEALKKIQSSIAIEHYLNAREAAEYIGISERLFNEQLKLGMWTSYRVGRRRVFKASDLDADLQKTKEVANHE